MVLPCTKFPPASVPPLPSKTSSVPGPHPSGIPFAPALQIFSAGDGRFGAPRPKTVVPPATRFPLICGGIATGVWVGLGTAVALRVGAVEGVAVGRLVIVGVAVASGVPVALGVRVGVRVGIAVPVPVGTGVAVGV